MALKDEELLDFDESRLAHYDRAEAEQALQRHGDAYRYQLVAARHVERWAEDLEDEQRRVAGATGVDEQYSAGYVQALREIAAHLRQGDYLPEGTLYKDIGG